jgi:hypothetical protein
LQDLVRVDVFETTLRSAPAYEAVSYVWAQEPGYRSVFLRRLESAQGSESRRRCTSRTSGRTARSTIISVTVTKNLFNLLQTFRRQRVRQLLWIDQLCINQADLAERAQQVQLMHHIYRKASRTVIWLGMPAAGSSRAIEFIPTFTRRLQALKGSGLTARCLESHALPGITDGIWLDVCHLFQRPWFARMWTVQEVAVARSAMIRCGPSMLSWKELSSCVSALWRHHALLTAILSRLPVTSQSGGNWAPSQVSAINSIRTGGYVNTENGTLLEILSAFANCEATDLRDKLYSLQGLVPRPERSLMPKPDYTRPTEEVLMDVAKVYIQHFPGANILQHAGKSRQLLQVPSWAPDWSRKVQMSSFARASKYSVIKRANLQSHGAGSEVVVPLYNAAGAIPPYFSLTAGGNGLDVRSKVLTTVDQLGPSFPSSTGRPGFTFSDSSAWEAYRGLTPKWDACFDLARCCFPALYRSLDEAESACQLCLTGGRTRDLKRADVQSTRRHFKTLAQLCSQAEYQIGQIDDWADPDKQREVEELLLNLHIATSGRTFLVTRSKHVGLAPFETLVDDHVVLVGGSGVPFIIRTKGNQFELIGECYLQGFMCGEGVDDTNHGEWDYLTLV